MSVQREMELVRCCFANSPTVLANKGQTRRVSLTFIATALMGKRVPLTHFGNKYCMQST